MLKTGLCSITFRELTPEQVIKLTKQTDLEGIEWGGDVHVPPGNLTRAAEVAAMTKDAGLVVTSYGSYYRVGCENEASFECLLQTAVELEAPAIRVWAGDRGTAHADNNHWERVVSDARRIAALAEEHGLSIHFEYHGKTLTDTKESTARLMERVDHPNVHSYWQPAVGESVEARVSSIKELGDWLTHVHVFHWAGIDRLPLHEGKEDWKTYLSYLHSDTFDHYCLLEFVKNDDPEQFLQDAKVLCDLVATCRAG